MQLQEEDYEVINAIHERSARVGNVRLDCPGWKAGCRKVEALPKIIPRQFDVGKEVYHRIVDQCFQLHNQLLLVRVYH